MKHVVYAIAAAWEDTSNLTQRRSWKKLLSSEETSDSSTDKHAEDSGDIVELAQQLDSNLETDYIDEWMTSDSDDVGRHLLSNGDIVGEVMNTNEVEAEEEH